MNASEHPQSIAPPSDTACATDPQGRLLSNMLLFARLLRVGSLLVTPRQVENWLQSLHSIDLTRKHQFKNASRAVLTNSREQVEWFDIAFELFWQARDPRALNQLEFGLIQEARAEAKRLAPVSETGSNQPEGESPSSETEPVVSWSDAEKLHDKPFAAMTSLERREIAQVIAEMDWRPEPRTTRRWRPGHRGTEIDFRRSYRKSLRHGGELVELALRRRRTAPRALVALCDVSGSMALYSRILIHFLYAITHRQQSRAPVESFAFGTRLTRITNDLRRRDVDTSVDEATRRIEDAGGGTRTGNSLREFNRDWAPRVLGRGAVILIISDGWDRGEPQRLGRELSRLHRTSHRLIWLNPLLGDPEYRPLTRGMQAALPHLDDFLPVHNLNSLQQLAQHLSVIGKKTVRSKPLSRRDSAGTAAE